MSEDTTKEIPNLFDQLGMRVTTSRYLSADGTPAVERITQISEANNREFVPVKNALPPDQITETSTAGITPEIQDCCREAGLIPLPAIQYWLTWGNQPRLNPGEEQWDYPTAEALLAYLHTTLRSYENDHAGTVTDRQQPEDINTVTCDDYRAFLDGCAERGRESLMHALDRFVGQHLS